MHSKKYSFKPSTPWKVLKTGWRGQNSQVQGPHAHAAGSAREGVGGPSASFGDFHNSGIRDSGYPYPFEVGLLRCNVSLFFIVMISLPAEF